MNILAKPRPTSQDEFLRWVPAQEARYEFDGMRPVAMTGASRNHDRIRRKLFAQLDRLLAGSPCEPLGLDVGIAIPGGAVRFPDALVTCTKGPGEAILVMEPVIVFEVLSPSSVRVDRIEKVRDYFAVPSIRRYVILEQTSIGATVLSRAAGDTAWTATALIEGESLVLPEIGIELPLAALYESVEFGEAAGS